MKQQARPIDEDKLDREEHRGRDLVVFEFGWLVEWKQCTQNQRLKA